jgi:diaminopimelate epimerase
MKFYKYHALGNDYIVINPNETGDQLGEEMIRRICHRHYGVGSDGILYGPTKTDGSDFGLRIFNPDGSEAEKSGNGIRIFAKYLWEKKKTNQPFFSISTVGGDVGVEILEDGRNITVAMGKISFDSIQIPVAGPSREVINEMMSIDTEEVMFSAATIGNPHCVIIREEVSETLARRLGPEIEQDERFPNRTNVQFVQVLDRNNIRIEIWERGAGYTLASGSSSCAAAAVAYRLGLCDSQISVHMPGGTLEIIVSEDFDVRMTGPVTKVAQGRICDEMFETLQK